MNTGNALVLAAAGSLIALISMPSFSAEPKAVETSDWFTEWLKFASPDGKKTLWVREADYRAVREGRTRELPAYELELAQSAIPSPSALRRRGLWTTEATAKSEYRLLAQTAGGKTTLTAVPLSGGETVPVAWTGEFGHRWTRLNAKLPAPKPAALDLKKLGPIDSRDALASKTTAPAAKKPEAPKKTEAPAPKPEDAAARKARLAGLCDPSAAATAGRPVSKAKEQAEALAAKGGAAAGAETSEGAQVPWEMLPAHSGPVTLPVATAGNEELQRECAAWRAEEKAAQAKLKPPVQAPKPTTARPVVPSPAPVRAPEKAAPASAQKSAGGSLVDKALAAVKSPSVLMAAIGAGLGAVLGFLLGGPIGALIGAAAGGWIGYAVSRASGSGAAPASGRKVEPQAP